MGSKILCNGRNLVVNLKKCFLPIQFLEQENLARDIATSVAFPVQNRFSAFPKGLHAHTESISSGVSWRKVPSKLSRFPHFGTQREASISSAFPAWMPTPK